MRTQIKEKLFAGQTIYVGIDVHKKSWKVSMYCNNMEHKQMSMNPSADVLFAYLHKHFPGASYEAAYEAGFSGFGACRQLLSLGVNCHVIHAADVPSSQKEKLQKTDTVDSRKLAKSLINQEVGFIHLPDSELEADRALLRQRFKLSHDIARTKLRVKSLLFQFAIEVPERFSVHQVRHWSKPFTQWLQQLELESQSLRNTLDRYIRIGGFLRQELLVANRQIRSLSRSQRYEHNYSLISSIPGIALISGMHLLVQIGDINRFRTIEELNYYIGLVPSMHGSGQRMVTGKIIKRGHQKLKIQIIEASWVAIRHDPAMMAAFMDLSRRMPRNKAIIRIARKLINRIRHVLFHQQKYETGIVK